MRNYWDIFGESNVAFLRYLVFFLIGFFKAFFYNHVSHTPFVRGDPLNNYSHAPKVSDWKIIVDVENFPKQTQAPIFSIRKFNKLFKLIALIKAWFLSIMGPKLKRYMFVELNEIREAPLYPVLPKEQWSKLIFFQCYPAR